ncbi:MULTISPECIES: hypothetical protein [unclassified Undibacterium]|uniref:hypothetical protein n=1 Tax=unclassified Undibacterium TaxID=2630295 RepID=UPI002AC8FCBD|nr:MULTISPECIES: hypothetical protein [unclassified Undibacterium]MEB0137987.1 hypothetical protein [Undibacterium sp. CCC2.1]MEB0170680.1 hypothetical protein [Undibacterium sp. CCC1.1]MEB0177021.1 hypothetical protein [Undibacterium sp. CCC3.4]MEB0216310.1 hypothetical protein [Undibacterium sp. 5I2]WPX42494.1 hypothetical protein RHM61_13990 [Undibacterium sp. CCC3.4]
MEITTKTCCPLGQQCQQVKDNAIHQCAWYTKLAGKHPSTGSDIDEYGCAVAWLPILLIENAHQQRSTAAAIASFRNEMVDAADANQAGLAVLAMATQLPERLGRKG